MDAYAYVFTFFVATLLGTASPGPATIYVARQGFAGGMKMGVASLFGILVADVVYIGLVVSGLAALLLASCRALEAVTYIGAGYLFYLGAKIVAMTLKTPQPVIKTVEKPISTGATSPAKAFFGAIALHATNPKALVYFGSIFPTFLNPSSHITMPEQLLVLAAVHFPTAALVLTCYAGLASYFRRTGPTCGAARVLDGAAGLFMVASAIGLTAYRASSGFCSAA